MREQEENAHIVKIYRDILSVLEKLIDKAETTEAKFNLITKKLSLSAFSKVIKGEIKIEEALLEKPATIRDEINAIALAICLSEPGSVKKMLLFLDEKSINDKSHFVWGYRHTYNFLHLAVQPQVLLFLPDAFLDVDAHIEAQIAIIRLLANKGANPNLHFQADYAYFNPPLAAGVSKGHGHFPREHIPRLRGALLLIGADSDFAGSSYVLLSGSIDYVQALAEAVKQYVNMSPTERTHAITVMTKKVAQDLTHALQEVIKPLQSINVVKETQSSYKARLF